MEKRFFLTAALCILATAGGSGCASIVHLGRTTDGVTINSSPAGADLEIDGEKQGQTPAKVRLSRAVNHKIVIRKAGYQPQEVPVVAHRSYWMLGNIALGGFIGLAVDSQTSASMALSPDDINETLMKAPDGAQAAPVTSPAPAAAAPTSAPVPVAPDKTPSGT